MKHVMRSEDFDVLDGRLYLGGRILDRRSILFYRVEKRVSLELLGFLLLLAACLFLLISQETTQISVAILAVAMFLGAGIRREMMRAHVLVIEVFQLGVFEVRGFNSEEAYLLDRLLTN